ncbi:hypothetical protein AB0M12_28670 [Nocardia vinacea]|uniref:hypothetical protein n=1 Tax=Nocardia vinacea TaxID=96468 RepID=UPI00343E9059
MGHALTVEQIHDLGRVAATTGNDPALDALIVRLHNPATYTYARPSMAELAEAVSALTGEPHPLADGRRHRMARPTTDRDSM